MACLAYAAPEPGSEFYAPFLVLVTRLWARATKLGNSGPVGSPVYFTPLDDGAIVGLITITNAGENAPRTYARFEEFLEEAVAPKLQASEIASARQIMGTLIGFGDLPDSVLAKNPSYGVIFSICRRGQLGIDSTKLDKALKSVTDQDLRRAATLIFDPARHAGAFLTVKR
jgi:zinc protease